MIDTGIILINKPSGTIYKSDVEQIKGLLNPNVKIIDIHNIKNLSGIENFVNLGYLYLRGNQVVDISALKGLTNLRYLYLAGNPISDTDKQSLKDALPNCAIYYQE